MLKLIFYIFLVCSCIINLGISSDCDCDYHPGGCVISSAASTGFKCKCLYKGFWTCGGAAFPCNDRERCPGNRSDYCACKLGGGDCDAYKSKNIDCSKENSLEIHTAVPASADCDCCYHAGGCTICDPTPVGFKCVCTYEGGWTCAGWAKGCSPSEYCPGGLYTYCGCKQGGGDCEAYPEYDSDPHGRKCNYDKPAARTCDCNRNSDWTSSSFRVTDVIYHMEKAKRSNQRPEAIGSKDIPNASTAKQTVEFWVAKALSSTYSFKHTGGIVITVGMTFEISLPFEVGKLGGSLSVATSYSYEWGKSQTVGLTYTHKFTCNGEPKRHTVCDAFLEKGTLEVPYTLKLKHNEIPNCDCTSKGVWTGVEHFDQSMVARDLGSCQHIVNGECINTI